VTPKPNVERLEGDRVRFADGSVEEIDRIVYATGYRITFPFLSPELIGDTEDNRIGLYRRVVHPDHPGLYFIGLLQPLGAIMPLAEVQSEWIADVLEGKAALPSVEEMRREMERDDRAMRKRYVRSPRHTIQVDFYPYMRAVQRERRRGRKRLARGRGGAQRDQALRPSAA
jgi:hypothetical protein